MAPTSAAPTSLAPTSPSPIISPDGPCAPLDVSAADRPPEVVLDVSPPEGTSAAHSGQLGAFRLAGRDSGNVASWDHDTIAFEAATTTVLSGVMVLAIAPDTCLIGVTADAFPYDSATTPPTAVDSWATEPQRLLAFRAPPVGDWFVRVHVVFQTTDGSEALSETFFRIRTEKQAAVPRPADECGPVDPSQSTSPPSFSAGSSAGDATGVGGQTTAYAWDGANVGTPGTWTFPEEPDWMRVDPETQTLQLVSDTCLLDVTAEALLTERANVPDSSKAPIALPVLVGEGSRVVHVTPPPTGGWTVRVRASIATADGGPAWSETLFAVRSAFHAPSLTMSRAGGVAASVAAGCPNYQLASGASSADTCTAPFTVNPAAVRVTAEVESVRHARAVRRLADRRRAGHGRRRRGRRLGRHRARAFGGIRRPGWNAGRHPDDARSGSVDRPRGPERIARGRPIRCALRPLCRGHAVAARASPVGSRPLIYSPFRGAIAQLEEHLNGMQGVRGSSPRSSTSPRRDRRNPTPRRRGEGSIVSEAHRDRHRRERTRIERYDPAAIEPRWQARWAELGLYRTDLGRRRRAPSTTC